MFSLSSNPNFSLCILFLFLLSQIVKSERPISSSSFLRLPSDNESDAGDAQVCPIELNRAGSCPVKCFRPDPVCGEGGVTYWCGCSEARCAGARVVKAGFCEVGNGGSGSLSGQAFLLVHIVWLIVLGFSLLCGLL